MIILGLRKKNALWCLSEEAPILGYLHGLMLAHWLLTSHTSSLEFKSRRKHIAVTPAPLKMCSIFSVYACVNTHIIKNRFSASIPVNEAERAKSGILLVRYHALFGKWGGGGGGGGGGVNESEHKLGGISGSC